MAKSKTIRVTPNVQKCLEELKAAAKALPAGDLKKERRELSDTWTKLLKASLSLKEERFALEEH